MYEKLQQSSVKQRVVISQGTIVINIGIWNMQGKLPPTNSVKQFITFLSKYSPEVISICTQECQRSINMSFFCENKQAWENCIRESAEGYTLIDSMTMNALHTAILIRKQQSKSYVKGAKRYLKAGLCNLLGNKGAISLCGSFIGQHFQIINCHLAAHQNSNNKRNEVLIKISETFVDKKQKSEVFVCGDLNYRIGVTHEQYHKLVGNKRNVNSVMKYTQMINKDQLTNQPALQKQFLKQYQQNPITFPPTYKIFPNSSEYFRDRIPGWTDRIFHRKDRAQQISYQCLYEVHGTDHRPVVGSYRLQVEQGVSVYEEQKQKQCQLI